MKYIHYRTNGTVEIVESEKPLELKQLQDLVGGNIEFAPQEENGGVPMVNEDGLGLMLARNPFFKPPHQAYYVGDILLGKMVAGEEGDDFVGFTDEELPKYMKKPIGYDQSIFKANKVFTFITIGDFMGQTAKSEIKSTGEIYKGVPVFKENRKGAKKKFAFRKLDDPETLIFEGYDLPFKIDGEITVEQSNGFTSRVIRGNALLNLCGDPEVIKDWVKNKNINPFFSAFDRINHIDGETETLLFTDVFTDSRLVEEKRESQSKRK